MIKIENFEVVGWEHAIRGMRNPKNSWEKSDSTFKETTTTTCLNENGNPKTMYVRYDALSIGPNDHELMMKLRDAGTDHRKVIRYLDVYVDITAPFYWWKEFKTYRRGRKFMDDDEDILEPWIETNSCSTMHKITEKEFTLDDFSCEHLHDNPIPTRIYSTFGMMEATVRNLNLLRELYLETGDKEYWWQIIQLLPSSYNQKRTVKLNYETLARMYHARKNHKLDEWRELCRWIESLPYSELITGKMED